MAMNQFEQIREFEDMTELLLMDIKEVSSHYIATWRDTAVHGVVTHSWSGWLPTVSVNNLSVIHS